MKKPGSFVTKIMVSAMLCVGLIIIIKAVTYLPKCCLLSVGNSNHIIDTSSVKKAKECKWWNGNNFTSTSVEARRSIPFINRIYTVDYKYTRYDNYNSFATDYYSDAKGISFGVNSNTGELVYVNLKSLSFWKSELKLDDIANIKKIGEKMAERYAAIYIDLDDYILYSTSQKPYRSITDSNVKMTFLTYTYVKLINGDPSSAYVSVQITSKGHLASIVIGDLNAFPDINSFSKKRKEQLDRFNDIDVDNTVISKLEEMTKGLDAPSFEITDKYYALTPDGDIVICVTATCSYTYINSENVKDTYTEVFEFIIK
ncbi:MAG: hypothetical protein K6E46_00755 [Lachnospiraceae bacterium]|nr:hypothetical protein [Lachnospiraceae bacterium]